MGVYTEYIDENFSFQQLQAERKKQIKRIEQIRKRPLLVFAADLKKANVPILINEADKIPFKDQVANIKSDEIDILLETPGGYAEVVDDLVNYLRKNYSKVGIIVPGTAKSAGTIFTMGGDEIFMTDMSALGPIDAQVQFNGNNRLSADAFIDGLDNIKDEVLTKGKLNPAYIPMLQNINPGMIEHCKNAQSLSRTLVKSWLEKYKFKYWDTHSSTGKPVTQEEKENRANTIASKLCEHKKWLSHGRSIRIDDLRDLGLKVDRIEDKPDLYDAVNRYNILLHLTFDSTTIYKVYETATSQIFSSQNPLAQNQQKQPQNPLLAQSKTINANTKCPKCGTNYTIQLNLAPNIPILNGNVPYPKNNILTCKSCSNQIDLRPLRMQIEAQTKRPIITQ